MAVGGSVSTAPAGPRGSRGKRGNGPCGASWQSGGAFPRAKRCLEARSAVVPSWRRRGNGPRGPRGSRGGVPPSEALPRGAKRRFHERGGSWQSGDMSFPRAKRCLEARSAVVPSGEACQRPLRGLVAVGGDRGNRGICRFPERSVFPRPKAVSTSGGKRVNGPCGPRGNRGGSWQSGDMSFPRAQRCLEARSAVSSSGGKRVNGPCGASWQSGGAFPRAKRCLEARSAVVPSWRRRGNGPRGPRGSRGRSWQSGDMSFPRAKRFPEAEGRFHERREACQRPLRGLVAVGGYVVSPSAALPRGAKRRFLERGKACQRPLRGLVAIGGDRGSRGICRFPERSVFPRREAPFPRAGESVSTAPAGPRGNRGGSWQSGDMSFPRAKRCLEARSAVVPSAALPRGAKRRCPESTRTSNEVVEIGVVE
ncbi:hypothetical protein L21SP4_01247 [Kiritimatiella glycovorans]|uniref:Uncharacterized protein n=1 Tax=Kiritimatiella glycovorans TaxID=1307763 RepID=A0A0G3EI52_9BACT|nr:hypothetical protein L21SP4_01247 [Kiritimatiella glycovorans]